MERDNEDTLAATYAACTCGTITEDHTWGCASNPALPSRRVFRIDVGDIPEAQLKGFIEDVRRAMSAPNRSPVIAEPDVCWCGHPAVEHRYDGTQDEWSCLKGCVGCGGRALS